MMRIRSGLALLTSATLVAAGLVLTACSSGSPLPDALRGLPSPSASPSASASPAPVDTSCNPTASLRPVGALPAPGQMPAGSKMAEIRKNGRLILGTSQDTLLFSSRNPLTGQVEGFDVDMGRQIAQAIFGDPGKLQIKVISNEERLTAVTDGSVDLVAETMTVNCARAAQVDFSAVYYDAGQKVLVSKNSGVRGIADLGGKKVCAAAGSTSLVTLDRQPAKPIAVAKPTFGDCLVAFQQNQVDAISTDDAILAGMAAQDPYAKVVGRRFTEEPYGMAMSKNSPEFTRFVNAVLARDMANGTWTRIYQKWLGRFAPTPQPPKAEYK